MERIVQHLAAITLGWIRLHHTLILHIAFKSARRSFRIKHNFSSGMGNLLLFSSMVSTDKF